MLAKIEYMNRVNFSARSFLRSNKNKDGSQTVGLRVTYLNKKKDFSLNIKISAKEYRQIKKGSGLRLTNLIMTKRSIEEAENKAYTIFKELGDKFAFNGFKEKYFGTLHAHNGMKGISEVIDEFIKSKSSSYSTKLGYKTLKNKILDFKGNLAIKEVDKLYFEMFHSHLSDTDLSLNSVVVNLRYLRAVIYYAQETGYINPFKLKVPSAKQNSTRGFYIESSRMKELLEYRPENYYEQRALDFFAISFFMQGANIGDILKLKFKHIEENVIRFNRSKVEYTSENSLITVYLGQYLKKLIAKYQIEENKQGYIFHVLIDKNSEKELHNAKQDFLKNINKYLGIISKKLKFERAITTNCARHSFTSYLVNEKGVSITQVQPLLGHQSANTTARYVKKLNPINEIQLNFEGDFNLETK